MHKKCILIGLCFILSFQCLQAQNKKVTIYLLPGQGADHRLFSNLEFDSTFNVVNIEYGIPEKGTTLKNLAQQISTKIDTTENFILLGTSLGGMLSCEISETLSPELTIIISSAKNRNELPWTYRFQRSIPIYKLVPPRFAKWGALILQPLVEPDRNKEKETFKSMLGAKDPKYMRRTIEMIIGWERTISPKEIIHIHGDADNTLPIKNISASHIIKDGSHMMTLTKGQELSALIKSILNKS